MASIGEITIEQRLLELEHKWSRAKWLNRMVMVLLLLVIAAIVAGISRDSRTITARAFSVVDQNGKERALLGLIKQGPGLTLSDENGKLRAALTAEKDGPRLALYDENGEVRAGLAAVKEGTGLYLYENGKVRAALVTGKHRPGLPLYDENGKLRATLGSSRTETKDGKVITYPESSLLLFKPDGTVLWQAPPQR